MAETILLRRIRQKTFFLEFSATLKNPSHLFPYVFDSQVYRADQLRHLSQVPPDACHRPEAFPWTTRIACVQSTPDNRHGLVLKKESRLNVFHGNWVTSMVSGRRLISAASLIIGCLAVSPAFAAAKDVDTDSATGSEVIATSTSTCKDFTNPLVSLTYGPGATATGKHGVAIGCAVQNRGNNSVAVGTGAYVAEKDKITLKALEGATAIGHGATVLTHYGIAIGTAAFASGEYSSLGQPGERRDDGRGLIMENIKKVYSSPIAIGHNAEASGRAATAIGSDTQATGNGAVALGMFNLAEGRLSTAFGIASYAGGEQSTSLGTFTAVTGDRAIGIGTNVTALGTDASAIGTNAIAAGTRAIAFGSSVNNATLSNNGNFRQNSETNTQANGLDSIAIGTSARATNANTVAIGTGAQTIQGDSIAIGRGTYVDQAGGIALGEGSRVEKDIPITTSGTVYGQEYTYAGKPIAALSIGDTGRERLILNVAPGRVLSTSTDAVNGSQLWAAYNSIDQVGTNLATLGINVTAAFGGGSSYVNGVWTGPSYTIQNNSYTNVGSAFEAVDGNLSSLKDDISNITITGGTLGPVQRTVAADTLTLVASDGSAANPGAGQKLTNLKAGTVADGSLDAINGSQLFGFGTDMATVLGGGASYIDGKWTGPSYTIQNNSYTNVGSAFEAVDGNLTSLKDDVSNISTSITNGVVGPVRRVDKTNTLTLVDENGAADKPGEAQVLTNVAAGHIGLSSLDAINGAQLQKFGNNLAGVIGGNAQFSDGKWVFPTFSIQGTDYADIWSAFNAVDTNLTQLSANGGGTGFENMVRGGGGDEGVLYDQNGEGSRSNQVTLEGGNPDAPVILANVADGAENTDAVNVKQLKEVKTQVDVDMQQVKQQTTAYVDTRSQQTLQQANAYTDTRAQQTLQQANAYTDMKYEQLNREIGSVRKEARQAAAVGLAAASLRYDDRPGKISMAVGGGAWRGEGALAVGIGYTSPDGAIRANLSGTTAGKNFGVGGGLSFTLN